MGPWGQMAKLEFETKSQGYELVYSWICFSFGTRSCTQDLLFDVALWFSVILSSHTGESPMVLCFWGIKWLFSIFIWDTCQGEEI